MEIKPNDLIKIKDTKELIKCIPNNLWVIEALRRTPYAVVRRASFKKNLIPVGIRGTARSERFALEIKRDNILEVISPDYISSEKLWENNTHIKSLGFLKSLEEVDYIFNLKGIPWGPTGSFGFELVTKINTVNVKSDLDLLIKPKLKIDVSTAKLIDDELSKLHIAVDAQIEVPSGSISLKEYKENNKLILLRTNEGPILVKNPWISI